MLVLLLQRLPSLQSCNTFFKFTSNACIASFWMPSMFTSQVHLEKEQVKSFILCYLLLSFFFAHFIPGSVSCLSFTCSFFLFSFSSSLFFSLILCQSLQTCACLALNPAFYLLVSCREEEGVYVFSPNKKKEEEKKDRRRQEPGSSEDWTGNEFLFNVFSRFVLLLDVSLFFGFASAVFSAFHLPLLFSSSSSSLT